MLIAVTTNKTYFYYGNHAGFPHIDVFFI